MSRRSILQRKSRRKITKDFELQLTSMMDMLIILVVFLLKSYSTNAVNFSTSPNIKLPVSSAEEQPTEAVNLVLDPNNILLDGEKVMDFKAPPNTKSEDATYAIEPYLLKDNGRRILPLYDALIRVREKSELLMSKAVWKDASGKAQDAPKFKGTLIIHADKAIRYEVLRKVMYTAGAAQYRVFKFVTVKKDAG